MGTQNFFVVLQWWQNKRKHLSLQSFCFYQCVLSTRNAGEDKQSINTRLDTAKRHINLHFCFNDLYYVRGDIFTSRKVLKNEHIFSYWWKIILLEIHVLVAQMLCWQLMPTGIFEKSSLHSNMYISINQVAHLALLESKLTFLSTTKEMVAQTKWMVLKSF